MKKMQEMMKKKTRKLKTWGKKIKPESREREEKNVIYREKAEGKKFFILRALRVI